MNKRIREQNGAEQSNIIGVSFSDNLENLFFFNIYMVTVLTPIDQTKVPDLTLLIRTSETLGKVLKASDIIIYEFAVDLGCVEEECLPVLERASKLIFNKDFFVGYSPERVNPRDKVNMLTKIKEVTSGSPAEVVNRIDDLYRSIITAGTYKTPVFKRPETHNAALMGPVLVVNPYYLAHKAGQARYNSEYILSGRRITEKKAC